MNVPIDFAFAANDTNAEGHFKNIYIGRNL